MTRRAAIIWVWGLVLIAGAVGGGYAWWRQQDVTQAYEAGRALADSQKWEEVLVLAQPYAERDDPRINGLLADAYINGPDSIRDIDKGLTLRRRAAEAGDMRAAYFMGKWILEHEPTDAQAKEAIGYIQAAADCGMPAANYELGTIFSSNTYVTRNYNLAIPYLEFAAVSGVSGAAWNAGIVYSRLASTDPSLMKTAGPKSMYWLLVSKRKGDADASRLLVEIQKSIENSAGHEYARNWFEILEKETDQWAKNIRPLAEFNCSK
jgi:TPR repeat protein|tara:strand:- start:15383 stop:16174 length:792 start_codon:yes stop_codon:yes gene_type:complete